MASAISPLSFTEGNGARAGLRPSCSRPWSQPWKPLPSCTPARCAQPLNHRRTSVKRVPGAAVRRPTPACWPAVACWLSPPPAVLDHQLQWAFLSVLGAALLGACGYPPPHRLARPLMGRALGVSWDAWRRSGGELDQPHGRSHRLARDRRVRNCGRGRRGGKLPRIGRALALTPPAAAPIYLVLAAQSGGTNSTDSGLDPALFSLGSPMRRVSLAASRLLVGSRRCSGRPATQARVIALQVAPSYSGSPASKRAIPDQIWPAFQSGAAPSTLSSPIAYPSRACTWARWSFSLPITGRRVVPGGRRLLRLLHGGRHDPDEPFRLRAVLGRSRRFLHRRLCRARRGARPRWPSGFAPPSDGSVAPT